MPAVFQKALVEETPDKHVLMDRKGGVQDQDIFPALLRVGEVGDTMFTLMDRKGGRPGPGYIPSSAPGGRGR